MILIILFEHILDSLFVARTREWAAVLCLGSDDVMLVLWSKFFSCFFKICGPPSQADVSLPKLVFLHSEHAPLSCCVFLQTCVWCQNIWQIKFRQSSGCHWAYQFWFSWPGSARLEHMSETCSIFWLRHVAKQCMLISTHLRNGLFTAVMFSFSRSVLSGMNINNFSKLHPALREAHSTYCTFPYYHVGWYIICYALVLWWHESSLPSSGQGVIAL